MRYRVAGILTAIFLWVGIGSLQASTQLGPVPQIESPIQIILVESQYHFGQTVLFTGEFESATPITEVTLLIAEKGDPRIFTADLTPDTPRSYYKGSYSLDLTTQPLRPFAPVEYWWRVEDAGGNKLDTEKTEFLYEDNRYTWQKTPADEQVIVSWTTDDPALGHTAVRIALDSLERMAPLLPAAVTQTINIYIYPSQEELRSALRLSNRNWVGGHADPELRLILTSASGDMASIDLQQVIPHEVAHIALYYGAGGRTAQVPAWLHEGLAVRNEIRPEPAFAIALENALENDTLLPFTALCTVFPDDESAALQAYGQSASLVRYMQNQYGNETLRKLISAYGDGADCSGGVERELGLTLPELEAEWLANLRGESAEPTIQWLDELKKMAVWIGLLIGGTVLAGALYFLRPGGKDELTHEQAA